MYSLHADGFHYYKRELDQMPDPKVQSPVTGLFMTAPDIVALDSHYAGVSIIKLQQVFHGTCMPCRGHGMHAHVVLQQHGLNMLRIALSIVNP